jgi:hypothetical protein
MPTAERSSPGASRLRWWREVLYVVVFYGAYSSVRNLFGSASVSPHRAFDNAVRVIDLEKSIGLFHEAWLQAKFLSAEWFVRFWNVYYGSFHFVVTAGALIWLYRADPDRYQRWRNALMWMTGLALIGFALFPLMPPRLLNIPFGVNKYGGGQFTNHDYGFIDSLAKIGGLWNFDSGAVASISNQYAAMPSLHCAWALWCSFVMWPLVKHNWAKAVIILYPIATLFCIVVTANHFWLDGVGGAVTFAVGCFCGFKVAQFWRRRDDIDPPSADLGSARRPLSEQVPSTATSVSP